MNPIRQGDVWLYPVEIDPPRKSTFIPRTRGQGVVLAEGEATGHAHRIREKNARLHKIIGQPGRRILNITGTTPVNLVHEEHETLTIPPGRYEVRIQREYVAPAPRQRASSRYVYD